MSSHSIYFTNEELRETLKQRLSGPHTDLIVEALVELIGDSADKTQKLVKAMNGIKPKSVHNLNDQYHVRFGMLSSYDRDETATKQAGLINANGLVLCTFIAFEPWNSYEYIIEFEFINRSGEKVRRTDRVKAEQMVLAEEFPEDF